MQGMFYSDYSSERYGCKPVSDWQGVVSGPLITGRPTNELQVARTCCRANTGPRAPRYLPMGDGRSRATSQSTRDMFHQLSPTVSRQRREGQDVRSISQPDSRASLHGWRSFGSAFTKYSGAIMTSWYTSRDVRACERDSISPGPLNKVLLSDRPLGRSLTGRARSSPRTSSRTGSLSEIKMEARGWRSRVAASRGCVLDVGKQKDASDEKRHCRDCL
ncbi:hypothetical protein ALC57_10765 [Trachymyrmex cornetzi]|uniref:Uncharacterized protein n=1 Tax=Trachymyrmex cornetzi TaxID=471704 RepID=A0A151J3K2_9HYME|nr:hypothetical protein ALC57_10765 [Trachymyrmex cornetzi]